MNPRVMNNEDENVQIRVQEHCPTCICGEASEGKHGLRWSRFHDVAIKTSNDMHAMVGGGDRINVLEAALQAAYRKGVADALSGGNT